MTRLTWRGEKKLQCAGIGGGLMFCVFEDENSKIQATLESGDTYISIASVAKIETGKRRCQKIYDAISDKMKW